MGYVHHKSGCEAGWVRVGMEMAEAARSDPVQEGSRIKDLRTRRVSLSAAMSSMMERMSP